MRVFSIFYLNHTPTTQFYTLSLHDALPISELREGLTKLAAKFGFIREIRGEGLMIGVELSVEGAPSTESSTPIIRPSPRISRMKPNLAASLVRPSRSSAPSVQIFSSSL